MIVGVVNTEFGMLYEGGGRTAVASFSNTWIVDTSAPDVLTLQSEVAQALEAWLPPVLTPISGDAFYWQAHYRKRTADFPFEGIDDGTGQTGGEAGVAPFYQSLMVRKMVGSPPRYTRGRAYLPFIGGRFAGLNFVDPDEPELAAAGAQFAVEAVFGSTTMTPVVHVAADNSWAPVVSADVSQFVAFQRRRAASARAFESL